VIFNNELSKVDSQQSKLFFPPEIIPAGSGAHPTSYQIHTGEFFFSPRAKRLKCEAGCHIHVVLGFRMSGTVCPFPIFLYGTFRTNLPVTETYYKRFCRTF
jgi:hypothetical protein